MASFLTSLLLLALWSVPAILAQIHLGPEGALGTQPTCYNCDGHGHTFPDCLNDKRACHHDEVCAFTYGHGQPKMHCQKAWDCSRETEHAMRNCTGGGVEVHLNECKKCCKDSQCTDDLTQLLKLEFDQTPNLFCPGECEPNDIATCVRRGHHCRVGQFCQVSKDEHHVKGECKDDHEYKHCNEELQRHPCDHQVGHGPGHHGHCFWDCCDTNACLDTHFGAFMTTMAPATTPATTTVAATTMSSAMSLWERVHGKCEDQLVGDGCTQLAGQKDVCHDRLALSICPKTCGLCDIINSTVCKDTVVDDGCKNLLSHEDVCSDSLAVFICPQTCNLCDELVNSLITSLVDGNSNATDVPPSLLPPSANPSDFPTFNCNDLAGTSCAVLGSLCTTSFVSVVCPDTCNACSNPIVTATTQIMINADTTTTAAPATTQAPMTTTPAAATMAPTMAPTTTMDPITTTMMMSTPAPSAAGNGTGLCMDHLNGMDCSNLKDVCSSVMALTVCPKFCNLCS